MSGGENEFYPPALRGGVSNERRQADPSLFPFPAHLLEFLRPERECPSAVPLKLVCCDGAG